MCSQTVGCCCFKGAPSVALPNESQNRRRSGVVKPKLGAGVGNFGFVRTGGQGVLTAMTCFKKRFVRKLQKLTSRLLCLLQSKGFTEQVFQAADLTVLPARVSDERDPATTKARSLAGKLSQAFDRSRTRFALERRDVHQREV